MSYTKANYTDVGAKGGALHFLRDELDCENFGVTVINAEKSWEGLEHDHEEDGQEEVYVLVNGDATLTVENEVIEMSEGDAVRVSAEDERKLVTNEDSEIIAVGAP